MGAWLDRVEDPHPNANSDDPNPTPSRTEMRNGTMRPSSLVELDAQSAAVPRYHQSSSEPVPSCKRISQLRNSNDLQTFPPQVTRNSLEVGHSLPPSHIGSWDDDVDILPPPPTEPTEVSRGSDDLGKQILQFGEESGFNERDDYSRAIRGTNLKTTSDELIEQQNNIYAKRLQVQEFRTALKYKREEEMKYRLAFMNKLNFLSANQLSDMKSLWDIFDHLQSATEEYLAQEQSFNKAEDELELDEYLLNQSMERFSRIVQRASQNLPSEAEYRDLDDTISFVDQGQNKDLPPAVVEYLSRVGHVRIIQERLSDLDSEWYTLVDKQNSRMSLNVPMDEESLEFLQSYDARRVQIKEELNEIMVDVIRLQANCEGQGLLTEENTGDMDFFYELGFDDIIPKEEPLKVSEVDDLTPFYLPGTEKLNRAIFINKWMLHKLRHSSIEIFLFKSTPELQTLRNAGLDEATIGRLSLTVWFSDDTAMSSPETSSEGDYYYNFTDTAEESVSHSVSSNNRNWSRPSFPKSNSLPYIGRKARSSSSQRLRSSSL